MATLSLSEYLEFAHACRRFERPALETTILGLLTIALVLSHLPLWLRIRRLGSSNGISAHSCLILAIISTEHFASTVFASSYPVFAPYCAHLRLISLNAILSIQVDIFQPLLFWLACVSSFIAVIRDTPRAGRLTTFLAGYIVLFLIPALWWPASGIATDQRAFHLLVWIRRGLLLASTLLCVLLPILQMVSSAQSVPSRASRIAMVPWTLALQTIIFACLALFWYWRLQGAAISTDKNVFAWTSNWYEQGGWHVINFGLLSAGQWCTLHYAASRGSEGLSDEEVEPYEAYTDNPKLIEA